MIQEGPDECGFQNFHRQLRRRLANLLLCKLQEQAKAIAVGGHCLWARVALIDQALQEESLEEPRQVGVRA